MMNVATRRRSEKFLSPLRGKVEIRRIFTFDIESKDGDTQNRGFTRPFLVDFYDGEKHYEFRNDPAVESLPWQERHLARGGCIDKFMRWLFAIDGCVGCGGHYGLLQANQPGRPCARCRAHREKYCSRIGDIFSHNGGRFDELFILGWLLKNRDVVRFDLTAVQSRIQRLEIMAANEAYRQKEGPEQEESSRPSYENCWEGLGESKTPIPVNVSLVDYAAALKPKRRSKNNKRKRLSWSFLDSFSLIPLGLEQAGKDMLGGKKIKAVEEAEKLKEERARSFSQEELLQRYREKQARSDDALRMQGVDPSEWQEIPEKELLASAKMEMDLDLHETHPAWSVYVRADCEVLYQVLHRFRYLLVDVLGGDMGITAPASSMKLFRRRFQKHKIPRNRHFSDCDGTCHKSTIGPDGVKRPCASFCNFECHGCAHAFAREGYYGGRTELFRRHGRVIYYYDINSSYPASMLEPMPVGDMVELGADVSWDALRTMRRTHVGIVECEVFIPETCQIPPLPVRHEGKLVFPNGYHRGVWDFDELELLSHELVKGAVLKVYRSVWYEHEPVFRDMVLELYHYRTKHSCVDRHGCKNENGCVTSPKDGLGTVCGAKSCNPDYTPGLALVAKLMLNALYGKFGMREDRTGIVMVGPGDEPPHDGWPLNGQADSPFWEVERYVDASYIIPQVSEHITALSRIRLWRGMATVISAGGVLYYVDTDSIMASVPIPASDGLGGWKREEVGRLLEGEFILPKLYRLIMHKLTCDKPECAGCDMTLHRHDCKDEKTCPGCATSVEKMKGVQYKLQNPENWRIMVHEGGEVGGPRLQQHRTMLNQRLLSPSMVPSKKTLQTEYDKRVMLEDGSSIPLYLDWRQNVQ